MQKEKSKKVKVKIKSPYKIHIITALVMASVLIIEIILGVTLQNILTLVVSVAFNMIWCFVLGAFVSAHFHWLNTIKDFVFMQENFGEMQDLEEDKSDEKEFEQPFYQKPKQTDYKPFEDFEDTDE